jgi:hypothetical protein
VSTLQKLRIILLVGLFFSSQIHLLAQRQSDVIWAGNSFFSIPQEAPARNFLLVFNEDSLEYIDNETPIILTGLDSRAAYSDRNGNFKFASNGWRLLNSAGEVLSYKLWRDDVPWSGGSPDTTMIANSKGPLFIEDPGDSNRVYLFYGASAENLPSSLGLMRKDVLFSYVLLDVNSQSIISYHHNYLTDTTSLSDAVAVRHGNGRDWWILKPGLFTNEYYVALLDPSGLSEMEKITIPGLVPREQTTTVSHFTQDGNTFIHFTGLGSKWVQRYDFDRCSGTLSNPQETDLTGLFREQDPCNFTISPDGSKFYAVRLNYNDSTYLYGNYQYDFETSTLTYLTPYSGLSFLTPNFKEIFIFNRLTPTTLTDLYFESIENPNGLGFDCNIHYQKHLLQNFPYMLYAPNFANYRLGPLIGSECDPLTTNSLVIQKELKSSIDVFPNPSNSLLNIRLNHVSEYKHEIRVLNAIGQQVFSSYMFDNSIQINLEELQLNSGIYWLEIQDLNTGERLGKKFLKN